jgi:UPF0042 nucleotide-binding protein
VKLVVVSGRSGSGKSTALHALEDQGHHCIDNLPVSLLPSLAATAARDGAAVPFAVSIDARNVPAELDRFPEILESLRARDDLQIEIVWLDAAGDTLVRRFSETRRRHPLTGPEVHLREALEAESDLLAGIAGLADLVVDTTELTLHELRAEITERVALRDAPGTSVLFRSFGFRSGVPVDADLVFDVRCLPNPHWIPDLRPLTGRDDAVARWLGAEAAVRAMEDDVRGFLERWLPAYERSNRSYLTVAIGCTGGRHRSVFLAERLAAHFAGDGRDVLVRHRELGDLRRPASGGRPDAEA